MNKIKSNGMSKSMSMSKCMSGAVGTEYRWRVVGE